MTISLAQHGDFTTADPFYSGTIEQTLNDSLEAFLPLVRALKRDLDAGAGRLWRDVRHSHGFGIYFRGQNKISDDLLPSAGRPGHTYSVEQERNFLHRFRRRSYGHYGRILTDWETLFLARHHSLPCRLLDWSSNPLVGLFWACHGERCDDQDGAVWVLVRQPDERWDLNVFDTSLFNYKYGGDFAFLVPGVKLIFPFNVSPRITAQACVFTYQDSPQTPLHAYDPASYTRENFDVFHVQKWRVPAECKRKLRIDLNDVGINIQSMYPDLQGLGEGIPQIEALRRS